MSKLLSTQDKIFVAGHKGLVGSALVRKLVQKKYENILTKERNELDLLDEQAVKNFFKTQKPEVVFLAAAKVGGIHANNTYRADFLFENLKIQNNVIWAAHEHNVKRLVFLGSSCIYPKLCPQPMKETHLLTGELEMTNRPYAIAKIAGLMLVEELRAQHNRDYFSVMPTNLYGPNDNFHPQNSHVLAALIRKAVEAKQKNETFISVWGSGKPLREFIHVDDCADAIVHLAETLTQDQIKSSELGPKNFSHINVGSGQEVSILELTHLICEVVGFKGEIQFDASKPDGTPRKLLDTSLINGFGWKAKIPLKEGIAQAVNWFKDNR